MPISSLAIKPRAPSGHSFANHGAIKLMKTSPSNVSDNDISKARTMPGLDSISSDTFDEVLEIRAQMTQAVRQR